MSKKNIHYVYLVFLSLLAASIPVSRYMISVFQFCLAGIFIVEGIRFEVIRKFYQTHTLPGILVRAIPFHLYFVFDGIARQIKRVAGNGLFRIFMLFGLVYLAGLIHTSDISNGLKELRNVLPVLLLPMFFTAKQTMSKNEKHLILLSFTLSASVSSFISFSIFLSGDYDDIRRISPFITHIHLSVFIDFALYILFYFYKTGVTGKLFRWPASGLMAWLIIFQVLILKSLTGVFILCIGLYIIVGFQDLFKVHINKYLRFTLLILTPVLIIIVLTVFIFRFYQVDPLEPDKFEPLTGKGNPYHFYTENRMIENGHYVFIYISEKELREEWNKVSSYDFDSLDAKGQYLKYTLIRYLTSKGLRKDANGLKQLDESDIRRIESGMANYIFSQKYSLYPRFYQVLWELDVYFKSGNPTGHSVTQRIESLRTGWKILKQYPFFGVGTGDLVQSYHQQYDLSGSKLQKDARITGSNQFLNFMIYFGITGFIVIIFSWFYPARQRRAFHDPLFTMFIVIVLSAMFSEEILRFQTGITFFAFFYSFFIFPIVSDDQKIKQITEKQ